MQASARTLLTAFAFALAASAVPASADCFLDGSQVTEGTRLGERVCQDGRWVDAPD